MYYAGRVCDVPPYPDDYSPIKNILIVQDATAYQYPHKGQVYITILNEALWIGDSLKHSLINPNQLRNFGTNVQDNLTHNDPMFIMS